MGNCGPCNTHHQSNQISAICRTIEAQRTTALDELSSLGDVNSVFFCEGQLSHSPLSYALCKGKLKSFKHMMESMGGSVQQLEQLLEGQGTSALRLICELGYVDLLEYYLPLHLALPRGFKEDPTVSVDFSRSVLVPSKQYNTYSPVHIACENKHIGILDFLRKHFAGSAAPSHLSLHCIDESSGENCALIASRQGDPALLKFLHEQCQVNFSVLNKRHENCVNVTVSASRKRTLRSYVDCLMYLVDVVGVDVTYQYEESLLLAENPIMVKYLEQQLQLRGIAVTKRELEEKNKFHSRPAPKGQAEAWLETYNGSRFRMGEIMAQDVEPVEASQISEIIREEHEVTPFLSTLGHFLE